MKTKAIRDPVAWKGQSVELPDCGNIGVIGQTVCGFLNTSGGYVVWAWMTGTPLGVEDPDAMGKSLEQGANKDSLSGALVAVQTYEGRRKSPARH